MEQPMQKMDGAGYVIRGTPWLTNVEEALEEIGDRDFYRRTIK